MPDSSPQHNFGKVGRIYPDATRLLFKFKAGPAGTNEQSMNPNNGYYYIPTDSGNYQAMVQLVFLSAEHGWTLHARTQDRLDENNFARVLYLVVDF